MTTSHLAQRPLPNRADGWLMECCIDLFSVLELAGVELSRYELESVKSRASGRACGAMRALSRLWIWEGDKGGGDQDGKVPSVLQSMAFDSSGHSFQQVPLVPCYPGPASQLGAAMGDCGLDTTSLGGVWLASITGESVGLQGPSLTSTQYYHLCRCFVCAEERVSRALCWRQKAQSLAK